VLLLTSTSDLLQVVTSAAVTVDVHASWMDYNGTVVTPGRTNCAISTATTTTVVASPAASVQRNVKTLTIRNRSGSAVDVTVRHTDGTTVAELWKVVALPRASSWTYMEGAAPFVSDTTGPHSCRGHQQTGRLLRAPQVLISGTSYTAPAGCSGIIVELWAAGGGGGGASFVSPNMGFGGGGAAGSYSRKYFTVVAGTAYTYAIGTGGTAGANTGGTGGTGGDTTFAVGATTVTAKGGLGGVGQAGAATLAVVPGGAGVVGTNGDFNGRGAPGDNGTRLSGVLGGSGGGGNTVWGGAGGGGITNGAGAAGLANSGGGGAGAAAVSASQLGGVGGSGLIVVTELSA
jgi:hypothetical protein